MAVAFFSALVLVGCGKDDDDTGGGSDWNGSYKGDLWVNGTIVSDPPGDRGIAVVSGGNTVKITGTGVDVTFKFGAMNKIPKEDIPGNFDFTNVTNVEAYTASIEGGESTVTFFSGTRDGNTSKLLIVSNGKSGDKTYNFSGVKQ
jgi:hypothetical protein